MTVVVMVAVFVLLLWRFLRRRRDSTLAGLDSAKPTYSVAPPVRSMLTRKDHRW